MNDVQRVLWDALDALHTEINVVTSTLPSPSRQDSLDRLYKVRELIEDAWKASEGEVERLKGTLEAEIKLRPRWAQGYSSDSVAAQCAQNALYGIFKKLGVSTQTEAMQALEEMNCNGRTS